MAISGTKGFFRPENAQEAVQILAAHGDRAVLLAGGTFLHSLLARGPSFRAEVLVDLQRAGLSYVKIANGTLALGAMTTFREVAEAEQLRDRPEYGAIRDALNYPPPQIRNMATVGGCVAAAFPLFDLPIALMVLDGSVKALGPRGSREVRLDKFFVDYFEHALEKGEFLTEVLLPKLPPRSASAFLKLETNANDLALLNVGACITLDIAGICHEARVVIGGGVGKVPVRMVSCENALKGQRPSPKLLEEASQAISLDLHPVSDHRALAHYRSAVAKVYARRTLRRAIGRLGVELG